MISLVVSKVDFSGFLRAPRNTELSTRRRATRMEAKDQGSGGDMYVLPVGRAASSYA